MTTPNVKRHAPHYVAWLTALVFVMAGCAGPAATPAPTGPPASHAAERDRRANGDVVPRRHDLTRRRPDRLSG